MEVKDWITLAAAVILAIGWFVTGYLNRVKDVAQKRLEYRLKTLEDFLHNLRMPEASSSSMASGTKLI
ncbi:MAG: hypothetical protein ABL863_00745 [Nitrosomonas sp.]